jgi:glycosyltransferase involved in cell wall biosynthesis
MKVLHINSYYSNSLFYKNLFEKQIQSGLDIDVFVPVDNAFNDKKNDYGQYTKICKNHSKYDKFVFHVKHHKILRDILRRYDLEKYSILHAHSLFSNGYIALQIKKKYSIPYIVAVRNTDVNTFFKHMLHLRKLGVNILKEAHRVVFLSSAYKDHVISKYVPVRLRDVIDKKSCIIPNGISDFWFENMGTMKTISNDEIKLLHVGDINKNKNILTTLKAVEKLNNSGIHAKLTAIGAVKDNTIYDQLISSEFAEYISPKPKEELVNIYRKNDILVLPSVHETFGLVYPEAMSQGMPVIYTKEQGFDGQFPDGEVGYSVNCSDSSEIADRITAIRDDYQEISKRTISSVSRFNWQLISERYAEIYNFTTQIRG